MELQEQVIKLARGYLLAEDTDSVQQATRKALDQIAASGNLDDSELTLADLAKSSLQGFGVLQPLLDDDEVEEIWINRPNEIFFAKRNAVRRQIVDLPSPQLQTLVHRMLRNSNRRVDLLSPFADAALEDGSRLHVVIPEVTSQHWAINIRKFQKSFRQLADLVAAEMLSPKQADYLKRAVLGGKNLLVAGPTQAGKTTLLSALLNELPEETRLITCEETREIRCGLTDWVAMQTRQANLEGNAEIALRRLVKEALRMRPDRLVIGEVREAESFDLLIAMNSGLPGICTIHANSAAAALQKLRTLPLLAGSNITSEFVTATVATSLDLVVQLGFENQKRKVLEICEVHFADGNLQAKPVKL